MKNPTIYYNPDNWLEISFDKLPGYKRVGNNYPGGLEAYKLRSEEAVRLMASVIGLLVPDHYCFAYDLDKKVCAYTDKDYEQVVWHDLSKV